MSLETGRSDIRFAFRMLRRHPAFAATAVATLALGIGATTAVFTVVNATLLRPLPYPDPERLVSVTAFEPGPDGVAVPFAISEIELIRWREGTSSLQSLEALQPRSLALTGGEEPEVVRGAAITSGLLPMLGPAPIEGRTFTADEERAGAPVALLAYSLRQRRFGGPAIGGTLTLDGRTYEVIGVMPPGFHPLFDPSEVWIPLNPTIDPARQGIRMTAGAGRLRAGATPQQAEQELSRVSETIAREFPVSHGKAHPRVVPLRERLLGNRRPALIALTIAVTVLLLLACANVANLMFGHLSARRAELTMRAVVGAARGQLLQQQIIEGLVIAALGGTLGLLLSRWTLPPLLAMYTRPGQRPIDATVDWRVLLFMSLVMVATAVVSSGAPTLRIVDAAMESGTAGLPSTRTGAGLRERRIRAGLVTLQTALAVVLLGGAGAFVSSLHRLLATSPGFRADGVVAMQLSLAPGRYGDSAARARFVASLVDRVAALPGIVAAGTTQTTFMPDESMQTLFFVDGRPSDPADAESANIRHITPGYFGALRVPLVDGRTIDARDVLGAPEVCMVSASFARRFWPSEPAVGHRVRRSRASAPWMTIVGVAGDVMDTGAGVESGPTLYVPYLQENTPTARVTLVARTSDADPLAAAHAIRQAIWSIDRGQPVDGVGRLQDLLVDSVGDDRFRTVLVSAFALIGLAVALAGVLGVTASAVASRTREMGIRLALGARPPQLVRDLVIETMKRVGLGAAAGLLAFMLSGRLLSNLLYRTPPADPIVAAAAVVVVIAGSLATVYLRARPIARLSPSAVLNE